MALATLDLRDDARAEAGRIERAREWMRGRAEPVPEASDVTLIARPRRHASRRRLAGRMLLIFRITIVDGAGRPIEQQLTATCATLASPLRTRDRLRAAIGAAEAMSRPIVTAAADAWSAETSAVAVNRARARESRERAIVELAERTTPRPVQRGLFDRRADRAVGVDADAHIERLRRLRARLVLTAESAPAGHSVDLLLVLTP